MAKSGLPILGNNEAQDDFFEQRDISTPEFLRAVLEDQREDVAKMIVQDDRLVKSRDPSGATAIQLAVYHGLDEMLGILLRSEVELDPFESAAVGDTDRVQTWIDQQPELLNDVSEDGFPLLGLAAFFGRRPTLELLLERGADPKIIARNGSDLTPLHSAVAHRDPEMALWMAERLIAAGAPVEAEQAGGFRPLHSAAASGNRALVELLLRSGADPRAESDLDKTPADLAEERGHPEVAELLR